MNSTLRQIAFLLAIYILSFPITLKAQINLSDISNWNFIDSGGYGQSTTPVPGLFESSSNGITIHTSGFRQAGNMMSKQAYSLPGSTINFTWSGSGGSSYEQVVMGVVTTPWKTDPGAVEENCINASYGNSYLGSWVAVPGRVYNTQINVSGTSYFSTTTDAATGVVMGTLMFCLRRNDLKG
jgi:hypothetical protein